jgi:RNA polymerase sigma factor for flagellar operon FliA
MTNIEIQNTWKDYKSTNSLDAKNKLVKHYYKYVRNIASKLAKKINNKLSCEELTSLGLDGLYDAIHGFDLTKNIKFETYSYTRIFGSIIDNLRYNDWVPRSVHIRQSTIEKIRQQLESEMGEKVPNTFVLERAGIDETEYHKNCKKFIASQTASIEVGQDSVLYGEDNKKDFNIFLESKNVSSPDSNLIRKEFLNKLIGKNFTLEERKIIYYYYYEGYTIKELKELLKEYNITESQISQLRKKILKRLKTQIEINPDYFDSDILKVIGSCKNKGSIF